MSKLIFKCAFEMVFGEEWGLTKLAKRIKPLKWVMCVRFYGFRGCGGFKEWCGVIRG